MFKTQCWVLRKFPEPNNALSVLKEEGHIHTPPNCKAHFGLKGTLKENKQNHKQIVLDRKPKVIDTVQKDSKEFHRGSDILI